MSYNAANENKTNASIKEVRKHATHELTAVKNELKSFISENSKKQSEMSCKLKVLEKLILELRRKCDSQSSVITDLTVENEKLMTIKDSFSNRIATVEQSASDMKKRVEKNDQTLSTCIEKQRDIDGKIYFIERSVTTIKKTRDHAISSLKGEMKIHKQKIHDLKRESDDHTEQCNSVKTSITQLRSRLNTIDRGISDVKSNCFNKSNFKLVEENFQTLQAKIDSLTENTINQRTDTDARVIRTLPRITEDATPIRKPTSPQSTAPGHLQRTRSTSSTARRRSAYVDNAQRTRTDFLS